MSSYDLTLLPERIRSKFIIHDSGCWLWTAAHDGRNYGQISWDGKTSKAMRIIYHLLVGPIPEGLVLDHLCRNSPCVYPGHLEPVTQRLNMQRGSRTRIAKEKPHCTNGHDLTEENTYHFIKRGYPRRGCKICLKKTWRAYYVNNRDEIFARDHEAGRIRSQKRREITRARKVLEVADAQL